MTENTTHDLKQVAALFNDCIARVRSQPPGNLDDAAEEWLKDARVAVLKKIENEYQKLSANANNPLTVPRWAVDPSETLSINTPSHSAALNAYSNGFRRALQKLMDDCGFDASVSDGIRDIFHYAVSGPTTLYSISIHFLKAPLVDLAPQAAAAKREFRPQRFALKITEVTEENTTGARPSTQGENSQGD